VSANFLQLKVSTQEYCLLDPSSKSLIWGISIIKIVSHTPREWADINKPSDASNDGTQSKELVPRPARFALFLASADRRFGRAGA
jgi:hypothetical protein